MYEVNFKPLVGGFGRFCVKNIVLSGRWVGWLEWSEHRPRQTKFYFTLSYPNLHFPTNFHQNRTKIAKVCYRGGFRGGW